MTYQPPQYPQGPVPQQYQVPPAPPKKSNALKIILIIVAAIVVICGIGGALTGKDDKKADTPSGGAPAGATIDASRSTGAKPAPMPTVVYDVPAIDNIAAELTVTDKQCFGSAGCNFKYELAVTATGPMNFDPAKTYRVTVVVDQGTTWERIHSIKVKGTKTDVVTGSVSSDTLSTPVAVIQAVVPI
ncbi:hypothetical protein AB0N05_13800 [Nocardia sp. NPDC051030]|uniref:hypothetical protein n=1 Tax=Nocardia sp. NPDC051030 TaxID=3155162 RepID=UPI0034190CB0